MKLGKINSIRVNENEFTSVLVNFKDANKIPDSLFVAGKLPDSRRPAVAIVGSRKPTPYGQEVTHRLAYDLAKRGVVIISGLALGIDSIAHRAALEAGGTTIAVMAHGLHTIYPASHKGLAEQIIKSGGAIVSEKPLGEEARGYDFLARNRIVSGLADAVIVTEATIKSGTLSTVGHAIDQNKDVFAVPGPINSLLSAGPNRLLQDGARVLLQSDDVLQIIAPELTAGQGRLPLADTPLEAQILEVLQTGVRELDVIIKEVNFPSSETLQTITMMELKGTIKVVAGRLTVLAF